MWEESNIWFAFSICIRRHHILFTFDIYTRLKSKQLRIYTSSHKWNSHCCKGLSWIPWHHFSSMGDLRVYGMPWARLSAAREFDLNTFQCSTEFVPSSIAAFLWNTVKVKSVPIFQPTVLGASSRLLLTPELKPKSLEFKCNSACCALNSCMHHHVIYRTSSIPFQKLKIWKSLCHLLASLYVQHQEYCHWLILR